MSSSISEMLMFYLSVFANWALMVEAEYNKLVNDGGWIPVSSETVYNQFKHGHIQVPHYVSTQHIQLINTDVNKILPQKGHRIEEDVTDGTKVNIKATNGDCTAGDLTNCVDYKYFLPRVYQQKRKDNYTESKAARSAKRITDTNVLRQLFDKKLTNNKHVLFHKENTYEVTEKPQLEDFTEQEKSDTKEVGYRYDPPKKETEANRLYEILSKYKIKKDDNLQNYALSRRAKMQIPLKQIILPKPFQNQYNNLNHLSTDPLLAVFLSNYGFYLQGLYGIRNNYSNLYGYLASNNIHNNKPFGFYKVFSDTDSSH